MAKKVEQEAPKPAAAKPVIAIEYNGTLYPSFQKAEGARAHGDLTTLLSTPRVGHDPYAYMAESGERQAIEAVIKNAERVHGILSRYLDAAKIEMPSGL